MNQIQLWLHKHQRAMTNLFAIALIIFTGDSLAGTLGDMADQITGSFAQLTKLLTAGAYIAGMGMAVSGVVQFKAHKDNPTQVPIGKPIALVLIAAALISLPTILASTSETLFGASGINSGPTGTVFQ